MSKITREKDSGATVLDAHTYQQVRRMLLVGLQAYGELIRLEDAAASLKKGGFEFPEELVPVSDGNPETVGNFADALILLDLCHPASD